MLEVVYKRLPDFCSHCRDIGHSILVCKWLHPMENKKEDNDKQILREAVPRLIEQEYVVKTVIS
jgi:hypothetical protein